MKSKKPMLCPSCKQAHIMLLKGDENDPNLKEIVGSELIEVISLKVKQTFKIHRGRGVTS